MLSDGLLLEKVARWSALFELMNSRSLVNVWERKNSRISYFTLIPDDPRDRHWRRSFSSGSFLGLFFMNFVKIGQNVFQQNFGLPWESSFVTFPFEKNKTSFLCFAQFGFRGLLHMKIPTSGSTHFLRLLLIFLYSLENEKFLRNSD